MDVKVLLGKRIREYRLKHGFTQAQLAEIVGVDDKHLSRIELGKNMPNPNLLEKYAQIFGIEIKDLFEFSYLEAPDTRKNDLLNMIDNLSPEQVVLTYKYVRTFVL